VYAPEHTVPPPRPKAPASVGTRRGRARLSFDGPRHGLRVGGGGVGAPHPSGVGGYEAVGRRS
jgi:hypothetical protein